MKRSIAMTTYNGERYVGLQLDSILSQTLLPEEIIICDDNSEDTTPQILERYAREHPGIEWRLVRNPVNIGWKQNFRNAISLCRGELVFLADQDDIWNRTKIAEMSSLMEKHAEIEVLASNFSPLFSEGDDGREVFRGKGLYVNDGALEQVRFEDLFCQTRRPGCTYCFRKSFFESIREIDSADFPHDAILCVCSMLQNTFYIYHKALVQYRRHNNNAFRPKTRQDLSRRIEEISADARLQEWVIEILRKGCSAPEKRRLTIERNYRFTQERLEHLRKGAPLRMACWAIRNRSDYLTTRQIIGDIFYTLSA